MKTVVHLTSVHGPSDIRIFHKECKTLVKAGYQVVLIAPHAGSELVGGVRVRAVSKPRGRQGRMTRTMRAVYKAAVAENAGLYHFHDPELIVVGLLLKLTGKRVIYDVHEDVPQQILSKYWIRSSLRRLVSRFVATIEAFAARQFDGIVTATEEIAGRFKQMNPRTMALHNWPLKREFGDLSTTPFSGERDAVHIGYFGSITEVRGARVMLDAILGLNQSIPVVLVLAGAFAPQDYKDTLERHPGWKYVRYLGILDREQVLEEMAKLDVGIHVPAPLPRHLTALPTKMFEFMAAGLPCVIADFPLLRSIIDQCGCGVVADPTEPGAVADAIRWLVHHPEEAQAMGQRGRRAALTQFCWEQEAEKLTALYRDILK